MKIIMEELKVLVLVFFCCFSIYFKSPKGTFILFVCREACAFGSCSFMIHRRTTHINIIYIQLPLSLLVLFIFFDILKIKGFLSHVKLFIPLGVFFLRSRSQFLFNNSIEKVFNLKHSEGNHDLN